MTLPFQRPGLFALLLGSLTVGACATEAEDAAPEAAPAQGAGGNAEVDSTKLQTLSIDEAPAPTRTFYWGAAHVEAEGFNSPADNELTIALDAEHRLRYLSWRDFSAIPKTFGDDRSEFPLQGTRQVHRTASGSTYNTTVDEASVADASHWLFRARHQSTSDLSDYVESIEATPAGEGWAVTYTEQGTYFGSEIDAQGSGTLYTGDPKARVPAAGKASVWSAPVEVSAPGFTGPPVDHLTIALNAAGQPRSFEFEKFPRPRQTFGSASDDFPLTGTLQQGDLTVEVDDAVDATSTHFVLRYHVRQPSQQLDYVEGIEGTREGSKLTVRYFMKGTLWGSAIDASAAGILVPSSRE